MNGFKVFVTMCYVLYLIFNKSVVYDEFNTEKCLVNEVMSSEDLRNQVSFWIWEKLTKN